MQIWEEDIKNKRPLSFIIPIIVYHGTGVWKYRQFSDYFPGMPQEWLSFIPNFNYLLTDLGQTPPQVIKDKVESEYLRNLFLAFRFVKNASQIRENWREMLTLR